MWHPPTRKAAARRLTVLTPSIIALCVATSLAAAPNSNDTPNNKAPQQTGPSLTIYSAADPASFNPQQFIAQQRMGYSPNYAWQVPGFGVVRETRTFDLTAGINYVSLTDVAQFIDPTTVSFTDLTDPDGLNVLQQSFQFDLVNAAKLYEKYIDREIGLHVTRDGRQTLITGKVLAVSNGLFILETPSGIEFVNQNSERIKLPPLPLDGLVTKPTLEWTLNAERPGQHHVRTAYQTDGMTWRSDYTLTLNEYDTAADLSAWVTLMNLSGASFENAQLKLIAGDVQRVQPPGYGGQYDRLRSMSAMREQAQQPGFEEKSFFEYHMYTLGYRTDVQDNSTQQLTLFPPARGVNVEKVMVYYGLPDATNWFFPSPQTDRALGNQSNKKVDVYIRFDNKKNNKLGIPLPAGKVRVYKTDPADGSLEFVGEDLIDHTPKDEQTLIKVGQAFDVVGERAQVDFGIDHNRKWMREKIQIKLRNHKDEPAKIIVKENMYRWVNWEIVEESNRHEKIDARTVHYEVTLRPDEERVIEYTVRYTW